MSLRVGLFGGCFNPVHLGHVEVARAALAHLALDRVVFIPSGHPPLKGNRGLAPGEHRLAMLELALAGEPRMAASALELGREGRSFTIDTVRALLDGLPAGTELFFLLGSDCLERLPHWKGIDDLHALVRFAVVQRAGAEQPVADPRLLALPCEPLGVSSTLVRGRLACGAGAEDLVPVAVAAYLAEHRPYPVSAGVPA